MKNLLIFFILLTVISCKKKTESVNDNEVSIENEYTENIEDNSVDELETYLKVQINNKEIKETYGEFVATGSKVTGSISELSLELPKDIFDKNTREIKFTNTKKSLSPRLKLGTYNLKGIESDEDFVDNNSEDAFYCMDALTMNTYTKMLETYGKMDKEAFLKVLYFDFVVIPDENNKFNIESIEEISGAKQFTEISDGKGIINNKFLIKGNFQIKLMKASSKKEFIIQSQFKTEYEYAYTNI